MVRGPKHICQASTLVPLYESCRGSVFRWHGHCSGVWCSTCCCDPGRGIRLTTTRIVKGATTRMPMLAPKSVAWDVVIGMFVAFGFLVSVFPASPAISAAPHDGRLLSHQDGATKQGNENRTGSMNKAGRWCDGASCWSSVVAVHVHASPRRAPSHRVAVVIGPSRAMFMRAALAGGLVPKAGPARQDEQTESLARSDGSGKHLRASGAGGVEGFLVLGGQMWGFGRAGPARASTRFPFHQGSGLDGDDGLMLNFPR